MINFERIKMTAEILKQKDLEALLIGPGADMEYLTEMKMRPDERLKLIVLLPDASFFCISPKLYYGEFEEYMGQDAPIYVWEDNEWFHSVVERAFKQHCLNGKMIGVNTGVRAVDAADIMHRNAIEFFNAEAIIAELRMIKDKDEIELMDKSGEICDTILVELASFIQPGRTEKEIRRYIMKRYEELGADFNSWNPIVAAGANAAMPHYSREDGIVKDQDVVLVDIGCGYKGYRSDITRTYFVGKPTQKQQDVFEAVICAQEAAEKMVAPGIPACDIHKTAMAIMTKAGFGHTFITRTGHGVGREGHELPYISLSNNLPLREGMCFSVEPSASLPGEFGVRVENTVTVTKNGVHSFNKCPKRL